MILSTIAKSRPLFTQLSVFAFAETNSRQLPSLNQQILKTKSWKEFLKLFADKKDQFTQETFHFSSRYVNHLLSKQRQTVKYSDFSEIIKTIEQFDPSTLTQTQVVSLLAILRGFCYKGLDINALYKLKNRLCSRYTELLVAKPEGKQNFSDLIYAYYEMVYFGWATATRMISERILSRFTNEAQSSKVLTLNQDQYLLNAISNNEDLSYQQRRLRFYILRDINQKLSEINQNDLVHILVSLNRMSFHDGTKLENSYIRNIGNKILPNITQLEEKTIFEFLRGANRNQHPIFKNLYEEFSKNAFAEVSEDGTSSFDNKLILRLFAGISKHWGFNRLGELQKRKFHSLINSCLEQFTSNNDTQGIKILSNFFEDIIENRFYDQTRSQQLVHALQKLGTPLRQKVLQLLYINKADISELLPAFMAQNFSEYSSPITVFKYSGFIKKLISNPKYQSHKQSLESYLSHFTKKLDETFSSPQKFTDVFSYIFKNPSFGLNFQLFHAFHEQYFQRLPNPFEIDIQNLPNNYKSAYLQYVLYSFRQNEIYKFITNYISKINNSTISKVIYSNVNEENNPNRYLANLVARNLSAAIESKEKEFVSSALQLVSKYSRYVIPNGRDSQITNNILRIFSICFSKFDSLKEINQSRTLTNVYARYIAKNSGNYKNEFVFRDLVFLGLRNLKNLPNFAASQVLKEGLRLNVVQKKYIENVDFLNWNNLNYLDKQSLSYIKDSTHKPEIKNINVSTLQTIFFNHNFQSLIESKQTEINEVLEKASINDLLGYLAVFNQPRTRLSNRIIVKILNLILSSEKYIQRGDFIGAIQNFLERNWTNNKLSKEFAQKVVTLLSIKMEQFSLNTHFQAIRFAISIPTYNPQSYYKKLAENTRRNYKDSDYEQVLYKLAFTNYQFRAEQLRHFRSLLKRNTYRGIYLFLATENQHNEAERKQIVAQIAQKLSSAKETDSTIHAIQYDYLKNAYPEETKNLELKPEQLQKTPLFTKPSQKIINVLQQIARANQTNLQVLPDFQQNYLVKIKNVCFSFFNPRRTGSYHEHQFLRRALPLHFRQQNYKFIYFGPVSANRVAEFIEKQAPEIVTPQVKQAVTEFIEKNRPERTQSDEHDESNPQQNRQRRERKPRESKSSDQK